jgi:hypothetical protein
MPMTELFNEKYKGTTVRIMFAWLSDYFIYYGVTLIFPTILKSLLVNSKIQGIMYFYLGALALLEMAANGAAPFILNHPLLGFKKGFFYCFLFTLICSLLIVIVGNGNLFALFFFIAIIKIANSLTGMVTHSLLSFST